eukprot:92897-Hanusia_phi.AAC.1
MDLNQHVHWPRSTNLCHRPARGRSDGPRTVPSVTDRTRDRTVPCHVVPSRRGRCTVRSSAPRSQAARPGPGPGHRHCAAAPGRPAIIVMMGPAADGDRSDPGSDRTGPGRRPVRSSWHSSCGSEPQGGRLSAQPLGGALSGSAAAHESVRTVRPTRSRTPVTQVRRSW